MKKYVGWVIIVIFVLALLALVYVFVTKGYSGIASNVSSPTPSSLVETPIEVDQTVQETGNITSNKMSLVITSPKDGSVLTSTSVVVKGITTPGAEVFVNDKEGKADGKGTFSISVILDEGENQLVVSANDSEGNVVEENLSIVVSSSE